MSAEARRWWVEPMVLRELGGRRELEPSGVLFLLPAMLDMVRLAFGSSGRNLDSEQGVSGRRARMGRNTRDGGYAQ